MFVCFARSKEITDEEYNEFYKSFTKASDEPLAKTHFTAEGEVTFKSILFIPPTAPPQMFSDYGKKFDHISVRTNACFFSSVPALFCSFHFCAWRRNVPLGFFATPK